MTKHLLLGSAGALTFAELQLIALVAQAPDMSSPFRLFIEEDTANDIGLTENSKSDTTAADILTVDDLKNVPICGFVFTDVTIDLKPIIDVANVDSTLTGHIDTAVLIGTKGSFGDLWIGDDTIDDNQTVVIAKGSMAEDIAGKFAALGENKSLEPTTMKSLFLNIAISGQTTDNAIVGNAPLTDGPVAEQPKEV